MPKVLIIDDDADHRALLATYATEAGWAVVEAGDGETGIMLATSTQPDVVLCDLLMPGFNGFQVCRALRAEPALTRTFIIVASGRVFDADRQAALQAGADEYLPKPVPQDLLLGLLAGVRGRLTEEDVATSTASHPQDVSQDALLRFWGVRGSIPSPGPGTVRYGGNTSCVELRADGEIIILDAGSGLRLLGRKLESEFGDQPLRLNLLLSHTHWDHIQGLPFFAPMYRPNCHCRIRGYEGARSSLATVLSNQMESPYFPVGFDQLPSNIEIEELREMHFSIGAVKVDAWFANHPGICVGYRLRTAERTIAYFPDNEPPSRQHQSASKATSDAASVSFAAQEESRLADFLQGADILIMDAQYTSEEYAQHVGWGHGCVDDVVRLASAAKVGRLLLFHHDPDHDDSELSRIERHARVLVSESGGSLAVECAREGLVIPLKDE